jgi:hypothetical protein
MFCPFCKAMVQIGADDISPIAGFSKIREKLRLENFRHPPVTCPNQKCACTFDVDIDQIYLGSPDGTLSTEETFW